MKTKSNILIALGIAVMTLMLTATSCRDDGPVPTVYLNENFKEFIYFKEGTEWTYMHTEDSTKATTKVLQSEITISHIRRGGFEDGEILANVEVFWYSVYCTRLGLTLEHNGLAVGTSHLTEKQLKEERDFAYYIANRIVGSAFSQIFYYYPHLGYESRRGGTKVTIAEHYDSLKVGERYYHDIYRIHETNNQVEGANETNFYVARGYGTIRKEINDKELSWDPDNWHYWDLVESHVIQ